VGHVHELTLVVPRLVLLQDNEDFFDTYDQVCHPLIQPLSSSPGTGYRLHLVLLFGTGSEVAQTESRTRLALDSFFGLVLTRLIVLFARF
jgi:hypothetical protein